MVYGRIKFRHLLKARQSGGVTARMEVQPGYATVLQMAASAKN